MPLSADHQKEIEEKRKKQIQASAKKMFYMHGFTTTSMDMIAEDAHVSKGLIYHYFKSKEDLLLSFYEEMQEYLKMLKGMEDPYAALKQFGIDFLVSDESKYAGSPPVQILLTTFANGEIKSQEHAYMNPILQDFGRNYLGDFFRKGITDKIFIEGNPEEYGDIYWSFLMGKLLPVKKGNESEEPEIYINEILSIFRRTNDGRQNMH